MGGADKAQVTQLVQNLHQSRDRLAVLEGQKFLCSQLENISQQLNGSAGAGAVNYRLLFVPKGKPPVSVIPPEPGGADVQARVQRLRQQAKPYVEQAKTYFSEYKLQELDRQLADTKQAIGQQASKLQELQVESSMAKVLPAPTVLDATRLHKDLKPVLTEPPENLPAMADEPDFVLFPQPPAASQATTAATATTATSNPDDQQEKTKQWLDFYRSGGRIEGQSHTLAQIRKMTTLQLEGEHQYIQLLFPNEHVSPGNPGAPLLTPEMVQQIESDDELQHEFQNSFDQMLTFWGLERCRNSITVSQEDAEKHALWKGGFNHNHKRITRVLNCLMAFDYKECARNLEAALQRERVNDNQPPNPYWQKAVGKRPEFDFHRPLNEPMGVKTAEHYQALYPYSSHVNNPNNVIISASDNSFKEFSIYDKGTFNVIIDGTEWSTVAHYVYAARFNPFSDEYFEVRTKVNPVELFKYMHNDPNDKSKVRESNLEGWSIEHERGAMLKALREKVKQNTELQTKLLSTGDKPIFYSSTNSGYWGVSAVDGKGTGQNVVGAMLMQIRDELRMNKLDESE
ncbi:NADAR domain-containing protein [Endozoicomonas montiporae]|nr:NADAR domain-containing protein [Endozoicomonas montiporae]